MPPEKRGSSSSTPHEARGQDPYLPVLSELVPTLNKLTQVPLGLVQIALDQIEGTATKGRTTAFSRGFMPLLEQDSEFATKWSVLYDGIVEDGSAPAHRRAGILQPLLHRRGQQARERHASARRGEHRGETSRASCRKPEDSERYRVYQEFLSFYADTKINFIVLHPRGQL